MKYRFFFPASALILSFWCTPSLHGEISPPPTELEKIDNEIKELTTSMDHLRKEALDKEIKSQPLLFDNWEEFAKGIEDNEEDEKHILQIKKQIETLQQKKKALLKSELPK